MIYFAMTGYRKREEKPMLSNVILVDEQPDEPSHRLADVYCCASFLE
jgi:hypothetical protein